MLSHLFDTIPKRCDNGMTVTPHWHEYDDDSITILRDEVESLNHTWLISRYNRASPITPSFA